MPPSIGLTEQQIRAAMLRTRSNRAAAKYLNVSYITYRLYAKLYKDEKTGLTLFETHNNPAGKGIPKFNSLSTEPHLLKLLKEGMSKESYSIGKLKKRLLIEGYLANECTKCRFNEKRLIDFKVPLLLNFKNAIKTDWRIENLELLCYNCYFLNIGDIFTSKEQRLLEDYTTSTIKAPIANLDLDSELMERINKFITDPNKDDSDFISKY